MITVSALLVVVALILCGLHVLQPPRVPLWTAVVVLALAMLVTLGGPFVRP